MIRLFTGAERSVHPAPFEGMFRDRKRVFVDILGWPLPLAEAHREVDQFDTDRAVYLLALAPDDGRHLGSVRLLPSTSAHLLDEVFPDLCTGGVPRGPAIWEASRLCTSPDVGNARTVLAVHRRLALGMIEFALANGINAYTCVTESRHVAALLSTGWAVEPLSLPTVRDGTLIEALSIAIEPSTLHKVRVRTGVAAAVLDFPEAARRHAA
jgi:N-acyl-L-homoserine lactone synthetase